MILQFGNQATEDLYNGLDTKESRRIPISIWKVASRKLDMINAAGNLKDLTVPPANRLESLRGNLSGYYSIRINDQFRIIFLWQGGNASHVSIVDYHK